MNLEKGLRDALNLEHVRACASEETNEKIQETIRKHSAIQKKKAAKKQLKPAIAAICIALLAGIWQFPAVKAVSMKALRYFTTTISFSDGDTNKSLEWKDAYVSIPEKAPKENCVLKTMQEARELTGMNFLKSKYEYQGERPVVYDVYVSDGGTLNGFMVIDDFYATGDLTDISVDWWIEDDGTLATGQSSYHAGKEYKSPVMMQILVRSDQSEGVDDQNHGLEYAGTNLDYTDPAWSSDVEIISLDNLGVQAVIETVPMTDGPASWTGTQIPESAQAYNAFFTYKGMEYTFMGFVSRETMKELLETLE